MAKYKSSILTKNGQELMAKATAGEAKIEFTKFVFGSGEWSDEEITSSISELKNSEQTVSISSMKISENQKNVVSLSAVLSNESLEEGYYINEIGLYARDKNLENSEEILYSIVIAEKNYADFLPDKNYAPVKILQDFYIEVSDASDTAIAVDNKAAVTLPFLKENYYSKKEVDSKLLDTDNKLSDSEKVINGSIDKINTRINELVSVSAITSFASGTFEEFKSSLELQDIKSGSIFYIVYLKSGIACLLVTESSHEAMEDYTITQQISYGANHYTRTANMGQGIMHPVWNEWE